MIFFVLVIPLCFFWILPGRTGLSIRPKLFDLGAIFASLFFVFYFQVYFVNEVILGQKVELWLSVGNEDYLHVKIFLLLYLTLFWVGYFSYPNRPTKGLSATNKFPTMLALITGTMSVTAFIVYIQITGGLYSFITNHRAAVYADQWSTGSVQMTTNYLRILSNFAFLITAVAGGYLQGKSKNIRKRKRIIYLLFPLPGTLVKMALLSRGFFMFYLLYFIAMEVTIDRSRLFKARVIVLLILTLIGVMTGMISRSPDRFQLSNAYDYFLLLSNSLDGLSAILDTVAVSAGASLAGLERMIGQLSPIPSFIWSTGYDNNLTSLIIGDRSGSSRPMPFIGEAIYNIGWFALGLAFLQGWLSRMVSNKVGSVSNIRANFWWILLYVAMFYWFIYMHHSGLRSSSRPVAWVLIAMLVSKAIYQILPKKIREGHQ